MQIDEKVSTTVCDVQIDSETYTVLSEEDKIPVHLDNDKKNKLDLIDALLSEGKTVPASTDSLDSVIESLNKEVKEQDYQKKFINLVKSLTRTSQQLIDFQRENKDKFTWSHDYLKKELGGTYEHKLFILSLLWDDNSMDNPDAFVYREEGVYFFLDWLRVIQKFMDENYEITKYSKHNNMKMNDIYLEFIDYLTKTKYSQWAKEIKKQLFIKYLVKLGYTKIRMDTGLFVRNLVHKKKKNLFCLNKTVT